MRTFLVHATLQAVYIRTQSSNFASKWKNENQEPKYKKKLKKRYE